ncbi:MAG: hypothetical protein JW864_04305, partial [Spirochaetes bacterium]|nr:hypothetical protein [Spirochaetota bacterium]
MRRNAILLTITFSILLFSCSSDDSSSQADAADNTDNIIQLDNDSTGPKGSLKLKIYNELNKNKTSYNNNFSLRTSLPDIDMTTDTFKISGSCSDGSTFSLLTALDEIEIRNMSLGRWIIKIEALNTDKTGIGYGEGSIEIFER